MELIMDTLDKVDESLAAPAFDVSLAGDDVETERNDTSADDDLAADLAGKVETFGRTVNWLKIAGYAAAAAAGAIGGYAYFKAQQQKPKTRLERLRDKLGLDSVDMSRLPASLRDIDLNQVRKTSRGVGLYAKKAAHAGAKKVVELTR